MKIKKICKQCGKEFYSEEDIRGGYSRINPYGYCSMCSRLYNLTSHEIKKGTTTGRKSMSEITRERWQSPKFRKEQRERIRERVNKLWKNQNYIYNYFKGRLFGKGYKPNKLDKEIIWARVWLFKTRYKEDELEKKIIWIRTRLFKIQHKGGEAHETSRL